MDRVYRKHPDVAWRELGEKVYVYGNRGAELHTFNEVGEFLWKLIAQSDDGVSLMELLEAMQEEYDVAADEIRADVEEFLVHLQEKSLVVVVGGEAHSNEKK